MAQKIGIFSGSFDPVHDGHIAFAKESMKAYDLDEVVFMPERFPRGKPNVSPISERITELEIALAGTPFRVLNAQTDQFTVDETLTELEALYPDAEFTFLVGSDVALNLPNWGNINRLAPRYAFAIGMRENAQIEVISKIMGALQATYLVVDTQHPALSSTQVRNTIRK